jgi:predicted aspartyl protease
MSSIPYDDSYDPPAPIVSFSISARSTDRQVDLKGLVDTGADGTIIPVSHLREIGARRAFSAGLRSQWGERRQVFLYLVDAQIGDVSLRGIYVVGDELGDECVLGRNVLNRLKLLLDGPSTLVELINS